MMNAIRPSKLNLLAACPASAVMSRELPDSDNSAMSRGRDLHERAALALVAGTDAIDPDGSMNSTDKEAVITALEMAKPYIPATPLKWWVESDIDLTAYGFEASVGTVDAAFLDAGGTLTVIDWKFGAMPVKKENLQLLTYGLGLADTLTPMDGLKELLTVVIQPGQKVQPTLYDLSELNGHRKRIRGIVAAAQAPEVSRQAGPWCRGEFCPAKTVCPAYETLNGEIVAQKASQRANQALVKGVAGAGLTPVQVDGLPGPLVVLGWEAIEKAEALRSEALLIHITDSLSAGHAARLLKEATQFEGLVEEQRKAVKAPVLDLGKAIDSAAKEALRPLAEAKAELKDRLTSWMDAQPEQKVEGLVERQTYEFEVVDISKVPREFLLVNEKAIKAALVERGWDTKPPKWLEVKVVKSVSSRGR